MTYEEIKKRLTEVETTLQNMSKGKTTKLETSYTIKSINNLTTLKESLQKQLLAEEETMFVTTKGGDTKAVKMDTKTAMDLKKDPAITSIDTAKGKSLKEVDRLVKNSGVEFTKNETKAIAKEVGKSLAIALKNAGDELARMKAHRIDINSFDIEVIYKGERGSDEFAFHIVDDKLHLVDFSFDKELVEVGVKPSGEAIINRDVLANELLKHFKSLNEKTNYKGRELSHEEEDRLDLIAHKEFDNDFSKLSDEDKEKVFAKRDKVGVKEGEGDDHHYLKVSRRDYKKAEAILSQNIDSTYVRMEIVDNDGAGNVIFYFVFRHEDGFDYYDDPEGRDSEEFYTEPDVDGGAFVYDAVMDLQAQDVEVVDHSGEMDENVKEGINDHYDSVHFGYDLDAIQDVVDYLKMKYKEGQDYELFIGRGDDLPNTVTIKNPALQKDTELNDMLNYAQSDEDKYDAYTSDDLNEGTELYDRNGINIKRFSGGKRGLMVQITYGDKYIHVPANEYPTLARAMQSVQGDLKDMNRQIPRGKNMDEATAAKIQKAHSQLVTKMKELAKQYKAGDKSVVSQLKDLTSKKKELEKHLDKAVSGIGSQYTEPGDMLKEFTDNRFKGSEVIDNANERGPDMFGKGIFADLLPKGVASENDAIEALKAHDKSPIKARMGQYAPMFVHMQYHELEHEGEKYRMHQKQYYNSNFKDKDPDFNPGVSEITLMKVDENDEGHNLGTIIVKTDQYIEDLRNLPGLGKRHMEESTLNDAKGGQIMPGDYVKNQHGNIYQRVDGKVGKHDAYVRVTNGKVGKKKTGLHDSFKLTLVNKDELKENVKVGDILTKDGKKGKVVKVMDDMANVDFGNGDVYGITFGRIKGKEITKEAAPGYKHDCAAKVVHEKYGKGDCIPEKHTLVKEGKKYVVTHYDVLFESGKTVKDIPVNELEIKTQNEHWHKGYKKKKK